MHIYDKRRSDEKNLWYIFIVLIIIKLKRKGMEKEIETKSKTQSTQYAIIRIYKNIGFIIAITRI